ncbi:MAG: lysylphosphatidylglycerol synthase transmembrane domain-containing protein [Thermodesulfobacteriota bacterium]|nr:lysylphosphatidylglycerol synthase transmembrane domain-containing protein [Thermodesulfobacteriota bacterium]
MIATNKIRGTRFILSLITGILFSAIALYLTFKTIPLRDFFSYLETVNYWWAIPSLTIAISSFLVRVVRWQIILAPVKKTGFMNAFHPLMIGFMVNSIFPGRIGEIARPAIFYKKENVPFSQVLATVISERMFDVAALLILFIFIFFTVEISPDIGINFGDYHLDKNSLENIFFKSVIACILLIICIFLISIKKVRIIISKIVIKLSRIFSSSGNNRIPKKENGISFKLIRIIENIALGFEITKSPTKIIQVFLLSLSVWFLMALSFYVMAFGYPGIDLSILEMCAVLVIICFFIFLPSVPGFWGLFEAGGVFGMLVFGIPPEVSAGFILVNHVVQIVPTIMIGLISAMIAGVSITKAAEDVGE